jgi:tRNA1Val (adenine37-N6)-methyltransferase
VKISEICEPIFIKMPNSYFQFKQFTIHQDRTAMKVTTDSCLFGAWVAEKVKGKIKVNSEEIKVKKVLDIGTGSGLLSLMFSQKNPHAEIDAIEIDDDAFEQAKENIAASPFAKNIHLLHGDARTFSFQKKYDLIVSNPPFYKDELKSGSTKKNIAHHGEELGLDELFEMINVNLSTEGKFFLLLPYKRQNEISKLAADYDLKFDEILLLRQSVNHNYFRLMIYGSQVLEKNSKTITREISIWNDRQEYTREFVELLKDYYLHL